MGLIAPAPRRAAPGLPHRLRIRHQAVSRRSRLPARVRPSVPRRHRRVPVRPRRAVPGLARRERKTRHQRIHLISGKANIMAKESSFDVVSTVDMQEIDNAYQQAKKELT